MKLLKFSMTILFIFSFQAFAGQYFGNNNFDRGWYSFEKDIYHNTDDSNIDVLDSAGYVGSKSTGRTTKGVRIEFTPNTLPGNERSEVLPKHRSHYATVGKTRWFAFSFKLVDDSFLQTRNDFAIIQQHHQDRRTGSPIIQLYLSKKNGEIKLNLRHDIRCDTLNADQFVNRDGEVLCDRTYMNNFKGNSRIVRFDPKRIYPGKWYHVRAEIISDAPNIRNINLNGEPQFQVNTTAKGSLSVAVKTEGEKWNAFLYRGPFDDNWEQPFTQFKTYKFSTFTHEVNETDPYQIDPNHFKFGFYGGVGAGNDGKGKGVIYFDEIYSDDHFSALPELYRN